MYALVFQICLIYVSFEGFHRAETETQQEQNEVVIVNYEKNTRPTRDLKALFALGKTLPTFVNLERSVMIVGQWETQID